MKKPSLPAFPNGATVRTKIEGSASAIGNLGKIIRSWADPAGVAWVRVNYGKNLGGKSIIKTKLAALLEVVQPIEAY